MSLAPYRKHRRPGNRAMTDVQKLRVFDCKELACIACSVRAGNGDMPARSIMLNCEYHHLKSGNIRIGHEAGIALCAWHHRGVPLQMWGVKRTRAHYGPSLMDGSALFRATYGSDEALLDLQNALLEIMHMHQLPEGM